MKVTFRLMIVLFIVSLVSAPFIPVRVGAGRQDPGAPTAPTQNIDPQLVDKIDYKSLAIMRQQEALQPVVTTLYEAYMKSPDSGFAGLAFEEDGVTLYWKGPFTPEMSAAINVAREKGSVEIKQAAYSLAEMEADAAKINKAAHALGGSEIQAVVTRYDGSGLDVERMPPDAAASFATARAAAGQRSLLSAEQVLTGLDLQVPVQVTTASEPIKLMATRFNDSPPWNAGGYYVTRRNGQFRAACTTGFGIRSNNRTWVLTAAHCGTAPDVAFQGSDGERMGPVTRERYEYDLILIDAPGFYRMFDNPQPNGTNYKNVLGWGYHVANELLCQSGVSSGVVCGLRTGSSRNISWPRDHPDSDGDWGYTIYGVIQTTQINGQTAVRGGDSGGPVFSLMGAGVRAKGVVSAGSGSTMYFQDWADVIRIYNGYPVTP